MHQRPYRTKTGASMVEVLIVSGIMVAIASVALVNLVGFRNEKELSSTAQQIATVLREASSRSANQENDTAWGVHFENDGANPYYALFSGSSYTEEGVVGYYPLPKSVRFDDVLLPPNTGTTIIFDRISGSPVGGGGEQVTFNIKSSENPNVSTTIDVFPTGKIVYQLFSCFFGCTQVTVTEPPPPVACAPDTQSVARNVQAALAATGGDGVYSWSAPGGTPSAGTGENFSVSYSNSGTKTVTVTSNGGMDSCEITVTGSGGGGGGGGGEGGGSGEDGGGEIIPQ